MRILVVLFILVVVLMADEYETTDQPSPPPADQSDYEPNEQVDLVPTHYEEPEKTWTKRILKDPRRVSKSKLTRPEEKGVVFDIEKEKEKLKKGCYPAKERLEFFNNDPSQMLIERNTIAGSMVLIGLLELRSALHFEPYTSWENKRKRMENDDEIADAKTVREYYELVEPEFPVSSKLPFKQTLQLTELVDKHWPSLRKIYKEYFAEKLAEFKGGNTIDRITVDYMIEQYKKIYSELVKPSLESLWFNETC